MMFDANCGLGRWPFRKLHVRTAAALRAELARAGIDAALVYSLGAVFYKDVQSGNRELGALRHAPWARLCAVVDPVRPGAEEDLEECVRDLGACAVRLVPGYHGYGLGDPRVEAFLRRAQGLRPGMPVVVTVRLEDERLHHPSARVPPVAMEALAALAQRLPEVPMVAAGARLHEAWPALAAPNVHFDVSRMMEQEFLPAALRVIPAERLIFGTNLPLFTPECAVCKLAEAPAAVKELIFHANLERLLALSVPRSGGG